MVNVVSNMNDEFRWNILFYQIKCYGRYGKKLGREKLIFWFFCLLVLPSLNSAFNPRVGFIQYLHWGIIRNFSRSKPSHLLILLIHYLDFFPLNVNNKIKPLSGKKSNKVAKKIDNRFLGSLSRFCITTKTFFYGFPFL